MCVFSHTRITCTICSVLAPALLHYCTHELKQVPHGAQSFDRGYTVLTATYHHSRPVVAGADLAAICQQWCAFGSTGSLFRVMYAMSLLFCPPGFVCNGQFCLQ